VSGAPPRVFIVALRPERGIDGVRALRTALKVLLRRFGLRCIKVQEAAPPDRNAPGAFIRET
jgi:hypothetical protein